MGLMQFWIPELSYIVRIHMVFRLLKLRQDKSI
jgi:hypothetical protein